MSTLGRLLQVRKQVFVDETLLTKDTQELVTKENQQLTINSQKNIDILNQNAKKKRISHVLYIGIKRAFDIMVSLVGIMLLLPVLFVIKIVFLVTGDTKSIFYTQKRIGKNGKPFSLLKIRSMVCNSNEVLQELLKDPKYQKEWEENQKFEDDPRITKIGKIIRKTSIDELPQFINILKGDMSLIGPRPLVEGELEQHGGNPLLYESVRPGLTGWWGCNGRSATTYEERLNLEYYYVKNASLILDLKTIMKTVLVVMKAEGAK